MGQQGKKAFFLILVLLFFSCGREEDKKSRFFFVKNQFIEQVGNYSNSKFKVTIKEFVDETLAVVITDKKNRNLYQSNITMSFSKRMNWFIYYENDNIFWFYNSDYDTLERIEFNDSTKQMSVENHNINDQNLPKTLKNKINE